LLFLYFFCTSCSSIVVGNEVKQEFELFFNTSLNKVKLIKTKIKIEMAEIQETTSFVDIRLVMNVHGAEKVLVLQPKNNVCAGSPVRVAAFSMKSKYNIPYISLKARSLCFMNKLTYLIYLKTSNNKFYASSKTVIVSTESPGY